jgi:DNA-binding transcriptional LysR family regulator
MVTLENADQDSVTISVLPVMTSEGITGIREAVRVGLGMGILPNWQIRQDIISGRLTCILPRCYATPLPANVVPGQRMLPARVHAFIDFAVAYMATVLNPRSND